MEFRILGPTEVEHGGEQLRLGGPKQRALLAMLLLRANTVVSRDQLIDGIWGDRAPASAAHTLEDYVSRLRKALGADRIATRSPGYVLRLDEGELDLQRFEDLVERGSAAVADGRPQEAAEPLELALGLWRGQALADVLDAPFARTEADRLEEARLSALERSIEAGLATGVGANVVGRLEALVRADPLRERFVYLLMLSLYRSGRQSSALEVYREARRLLVDELGLEPGAELQRLQQQILRHDPGLDPAVAGRIEPKPLRRGRTPRYALACLAAAATAAGIAAGIHSSTRGSHSSPSAQAAGHGVIAIDLRSHAQNGRAELDGAPVGSVSDGRSVWYAEPDASVVVRVDVASGRLVDRIPTPSGVAALAVGGGAIWASVVLGDELVRIDAATGGITQRVGLGGAHASALAFAHGALWLADPVDNALLQIDPTAGTVQRVIQLTLRPTALAFGEKTVWVADYDSGVVAEADVRSGQTLQTIHVGNGPSSLAVGGEAVWVANSLDSTVSRIDPARGAIAATIPVGSGPGAIAIADGSVWTADRFSGQITSIDPSRNAVAGTIRVGGDPTTLTLAGRKLWVGLQSHGRRRGGTLRLLSSSALSIDPAIQINVPPAMTGGLTTDGLVAYNHVGGPEGLQLVPDLAIGIPEPTDGGRTYAFRLRAGIRYSNGRLVRASDFSRALERLFRFQPLNSDSFKGILGATTCLARRPDCDLSRGVVTNDAAGTVVFHLTAPDANFLATLTYGSLTAPVPPGTPMHAIGFHPIPGTGPYRVANASQKEIRYVRNPFFREWSHAARPDGLPDEIVMRFGLSPEQEVRAIIRGDGDWMLDSVPTRLLPMLQRRYASQLHSYATAQTDWLQVNTTRPPFDDVRVRQALNFAIDRRVPVRTFGGPAFATTTCQILPRGVPGYRSYCPYTREPSARGAWTAPDLARAHQLVARSGTRGTHITVWGWTDDCCLRAPIVEYVAGVLRQLGYRVSTRYVTHRSLDGAPAETLRSIQLLPIGWSDPTADNFLSTWFACSGAGNHGWFCDPHIDTEISEAKALLATDPRAAANRYAAIDRELVDRAAAVPLFSERWVEFVSTRVRNFQHNPIWGFLAAQAEVS